MRQWCINAAVMVFFLLAGVGFLAGVPVWACAMRSAAGAAAAYVVVWLVGKLLIYMAADAIVKNRLPAGKVRGGVSDNDNK